MGAPFLEQGRLRWFPAQEHHGGSRDLLPAVAICLGRTVVFGATSFVRT